MYITSFSGYLLKKDTCQQIATEADKESKIYNMLAICHVKYIEIRQLDALALVVIWCTPELILNYKEYAYVRQSWLPNEFATVSDYCLCASSWTHYRDGNGVGG